MFKRLWNKLRQGGRIPAEKQIQVNNIILRLNAAAVRLRAAARSEFPEERDMLAFNGEADLRAVKNQLAALGMDYQG